MSERKVLVLSLALLAAVSGVGFWIYLANLAPAYGPIVANTSSEIQSNPPLSTSTVTISGQHMPEVVEFELGTSGPTPEEIELGDFEWSLDERVEVKLEPGFRNDDPLSFEFTGRDLGLDFFDRNETVNIGIDLRDEFVTFSVGALEGIGSAKTWRAPRANETEFREEQDRNRIRCLDEKAPEVLEEIRAEAAAVFDLVEAFEVHNEIRFSSPSSALEIAVRTGSASGNIVEAVGAYDLATDGSELPVSGEAIRESVVAVSESLEQMGLAILDFDVARYNSHNDDRRSEADRLTSLVEEYETQLESSARESVELECEEQFPY